MSIRRLWLVLAVLLVPAEIRAGDHIFDVYLAGSFLNGTGSEINLGGWHVAGAVTAGAEHRWLSFIGDVSVHFIGKEKEDGANADLTQLTFMTGPRLTLRGGKGQQPFLQVAILGFVLRTGGLQDLSTATGAFAVGLGLDLPFGDSKTWGTRLQADRILPVAVPDSSDLKASWRFSVGLLYRFHPAHSAVAVRPATP